jgi:hypothetical protein
VERLELRGRAAQRPAGAQHASDLGEQRLGQLDVLEDLLAPDDVERGVAEGQVDPVEGVHGEAGRALGGLRGALDVPPVQRAPARGPQRGRPPVAGAEVEHRGARGQPGHPVLRHGLARVGGHGRAERVEHAVARHRRT